MRRAAGSWSQAGRERASTLNLASNDFGAAAADLGYRDAIDADKAVIKAQLWWPGGPSGDVLGTLNGTLQRVVAGRAAARHRAREQDACSGCSA